MRISLLLFLIISAFGVSAQQFSFINYSVEDGLAQSQVTDICQDSQGYLWIGTESGGISRFNGIDFLNFSKDDGLPDNKIEKLFIDSKGVLWAATSEGIARYSKQKFEPFYFETPCKIKSINEFQGNIYLGSTSGLIRFENGVFEKIDSQNDEDLYLRSIQNYKDSILICGSKTGIYVWKNEQFTTLDDKKLKGLNVFDLEIVGDKMYISVVGSGLIKYDLIRNKIKSVSVAFNRIKSIYADSTSILGVTTNSGAFSLEGDNYSRFSEQSGLPNNNLNCIFKDFEKNIWIGTDGKGLMKFSGESIISYTYRDSLSSDQVVSINQDRNGNYFFGTYDKGITILNNNGSIEYKTRASGLADNTIWSIAEDHNNKIWVGTASGVSLLNSEHQSLDHPLSNINSKIRSILFVNDSTYLFGGDDGLYVLKSDSLYQIHPEFNIFKLILFENKVYCAGTSGLFEFETSSDFTDYTEIKLPESSVKSIAGDQLGNLWIGTENGLFIQRDNGSINQFILDPNEYNSKTILGLIVNHEGDIWVSTMNGVYEIIPINPDKYDFEILHYGVAEGLIDLECNENALYEDDEHKIWIGTSSGLARIDPSLNSVLFDLRMPMLHITSIQLFKENFDYNKYASNLDSINQVPLSLILPHNKNHLTFNFIGINLKDPEGVKYEYRLVGVEDNWSPATEDNSATYPFLQSGDYVFEVRAANKNGARSNSQKIQIKILSPFWKTWWFILIVIIAIFIIIIGVFQTRIKAIKQKQENERLGYKNRLLFLEQQSLNASMNRHFIFNSLNSIQYFINSSDKKSANKYLSSFANLIRKNLDSSTANNFIVTLQEEIDRIQLYLTLEKMRFQEQFEYTIDISSSLDSEGIEIPSMILQPFIENSIIHGVLPKPEPGRIELKIYEEYGYVIFEVSDDGVGIDASIANKKNKPSGDHESKGMDITNRRIELLRKLTGENLLIIGPFQMNNKDGKSLGTKVIIKISLEDQG